MIRGRENDQVPLIEFSIRERNQAMVSRSIVPSKTANRLIESASDIENALAFLHRRPIFVIDGCVIVECNPLEEVRWGELFGIADDNHLAASCYRADGVLRLQLRRFVHDD